jgi:hypothetical protein
MSPNALIDPDWMCNPDVKLGMVAYYGIPLNWPNGEVFWTICILDNKENHFNNITFDLRDKFRESI